MSIREIVALSDGRAMDMGADEVDGGGGTSGTAISPADFGPNGMFQPRKEG